MSDILIELDRLMKFINSVGIESPENCGFRVLDFTKNYASDENGRLIVSESDFVDPMLLSTQFAEITNCGYSWINLNCCGLHKNYLIARVERPRKRGDAKSTSVNHSGPSKASTESGWDISGSLKVV